MLQVPTLQPLGLGNIRRLARRAAGADAARLFRPDGGGVARQGLGDRALGDCRHRPRPAVPDLSERLSACADRADFERAIGRKTLGNEVASGTEIIARLGDAHVASGRPIVYTSADSVFQIAAHEDVVPVPELYRMCEAAYELVVDGLGVGRVIARPFVGSVRRVRAHAEPSRLRDAADQRPTLLDRLTAAGVPVLAIGKIADLFARTWHHPCGADADRRGRHGRDRARRCVTRMRGSCSRTWWTSIRKYGHRNDVAGYARNLEQFDHRLSFVLPRLRQTDVLVITADHGNDPTTPSTDHSREHVPLLVVAASGDGGCRPGYTRDVRRSRPDTRGEFRRAAACQRSQLPHRRYAFDPLPTRGSASARSWLPRRRRPPRRRGGCAPSRKTTSGLRFSAIGIGSSTRRRSVA